MNKKESPDKRSPYIQIIILTCTGIVFGVLTWNFLPASFLLKLSFMCLAECSIIFAIVTSCNNLALQEKVFFPWATCITAVIVSLLIPTLLQMLFCSNEQAYLSTSPEGDSIYVKITYKCEQIDSNGSIGDNWSYKHFINDTPFVSGSVVQINYNKPFVITSRFIERDDISDIGETISEEYVFAEDNNFDKTINVLQEIHVDEQGGRQNAGSYADFSINYTIKRVIPPNATFWELVLWKNSVYGITLVAFGFFELLLIVYVLVHSVKKRIKEKATIREEEIKREQQKFIAEKNSFLEYLGGRTIREAAGVPSNMTLVNGLPKDNNDQRYGTFTVYCSKSGNCFHQKNGCCAARIEKHVFEVINTYRPCSKCCTNHFETPKWYSDYKELMEKAAKYELQNKE